MQRQGRLTTLRHLLAADPGALGALARRAERLRQATALLRAGLPQPLATHCVVAALEAGTVVVQTDASAWAARLRFMAPAVLSALQPLLHGQPAPGVKVCVRPPPGASEAAPAGRARARPSAGAGHSLRLAAEGVADPRLSAALRRLARHAAP